MLKKLGLLSLALIAVFAGSPAQAQRPAVTTPTDSLAAQVRTQGFTCAQPVTARRDRKLSRPDRASWVLTCSNATYRIRLDPDMAAEIEPLR